MTETYLKTLNRSCNFFLQLAEPEKNAIKRKSFALSVVINSWVLLEAYINYLSEILAKAKIEKHEKALLLDKELKLNDEGVFVEVRSHSSTSKRILFILRNFSTVDVEEFRKTKLWGEIQNCEKIRNDLIHPKTLTNKFLDHQITIKKSESFRTSIVLLIKTVNKKVLNKEIFLD
ncbi:MAG: hypothetical protein O8C63_01400 [Candidatus Methanoperedens sp.]|nr:hypothetical protein [Candidatus Methanoperedens sp.]